ncbi:hypothetical protein NMG90_17720 [Bacillus mycoides]|uniref:hypothetical protein n=1 Tax=Bacillus mycoides TaxID=1405 RepID=UPI000993EA95|nr:hypothetical protein [Bacillus mycoides]MCP9227242.1 hypothetical protein [Bacillus mycoides]OOR67534.1 hypothetical protein BLW98_16235 [Bacillus mycoides]OOR67592.1 hypothetical protein BLW98_16545 [Bacillus mycoides]
MDINNNRIGKYLDGKVREYFNVKYKQLTVKQCSEFINKLEEGHTKEDLESMSVILEGEVEQSKLFGPTQTFYNSFITILVGTFIALFTCFSGFSLNSALLFNKGNDGDEITQKVDNIIQKADNLTFTFNIVLTIGAIVFLMLMFVLAYVGFAVQNYRNNFGRFHFYKQIIDKCIEKKEIEKKEKEEQERAEKERTNKLASSRKGSSRYR